MRRESQTLTMHGSDAYVKLMRVLTEYLSPRTALTLVNQSLAVVFATPESLDAGDLPTVLEHLLPAAQAFCDPRQFEELTLDLSSLGLARRSSVPAQRPPSVEQARPVSVSGQRPVSVSGQRPSSSSNRPGVPMRTPSVEVTRPVSERAIVRPPSSGAALRPSVRPPAVEAPRTSTVAPRPTMTEQVERVSLQPLAPPRSRGT